MQCGSVKLMERLQERQDQQQGEDNQDSGE